METNNNIEKIKGKSLYTTLTILFSIMFAIFKIFSFGWLTFIFAIPIAIYMGFYISCGNQFANTKDKTKNGYVLFWLLSFFFLLSGLTFVDGGDSGPSSQILTFMPSNASMYICQFSICVAVILMIISIITKIRENKRPDR